MKESLYESILVLVGINIGIERKNINLALEENNLEAVKKMSCYKAVKKVLIQI